MCKKLWDWLFNRPSEPTPPPEPGINKRIALLYGINNYPGSANDLQGCLNDIDDVEKKLKAEFTDFIVTKYKDSAVTCDTFYNTIKNTLLNCMAGDVLYIHYSGHGTQIPSAQEANGYHEALYLYDGPFIDDRVQELQTLTPIGIHVNLKLDSCFSGDILRELNPGFKNRFYPMPGVELRTKVVTRFAKHKKLILKWIVFSGCCEEQTSADAYINGRYNGAFTYFDNLSYNANSTYNSELAKLHTHLPGGGYDQNPTLDGDSNLFNNIIFT